MQKHRGQTLIEVLVALSVAVVIVSAITTLSIFSLNNAQYSKFQSLATQYAREGIDLVRKSRDDNYANYLALPSDQCLADTNVFSAPTGTPPSCPKNVVNTFTREVIIARVGTANKCDDTQGTLTDHVTVIVSWTDGKCASNSYCHNVTLESCLGNYAAPTP